MRALLHEMDHDHDEMDTPRGPPTLDEIAAHYLQQNKSGQSKLPVRPRPMSRRNSSLPPNHLSRTLHTFNEPTSFFVGDVRAPLDALVSDQSMEVSSRLPMSPQRQLHTALSIAKNASLRATILDRPLKLENSHDLYKRRNYTSSLWSAQSHSATKDSRGPISDSL